MPGPLSKGALVRLQTSTLQSQAIVFGYNPETLATSLSRVASGAVDQEIRFTLELDATDALEHPDQNPVAVATGVNPTLAALELLLRQDVQPDPDAVTLFVWGPNRSLPVQLLALEMAETLFDPQLNPIHANVQLTLRGLNAADAGGSPVIGQLLLHRMEQLQALAQLALSSTPASSPASSPASVLPQR
jgi:hypothetical protein